MKAARVVAGLLIAVAPAGALASCWSPTQITVDLTTDVDCMSGPTTAIYKGPPFESAPSARQNGCTQQDGTIGSMAVVPGDDREGRARIKVVLVRGGKPEDCDTRPSDCIVATRSFSFVEHRALRLPIRLRAECFGQLTCPDGTTCGPGRVCLPDAVTCIGGSCTVPGEDAPAAPPIDAGPSDASLPDSAPATCAGPDGSGIIATAPFPGLPGPRATAFADGVFYVYGQNGSGFGKVFSVPAQGGELTAVRDLDTRKLVDLTAAPGLGWAVLHEANGGYDLAVGQNGVVTLLAPPASNPYRAITFALGSTPAVVYVAQDTAVLKVQLDAGVQELPFSIGGTDIAVDDATIFMTSVTGGQRTGRNVNVVVADTYTAESPARRAFTRHAGGVYFAGKGLSPNGDAQSVIARLSGLSMSELLSTPEQPVLSFAVGEDHVYWTDGKAIFRVDRTGGAPTSIATQPGESVDHLVVDGACLYYWGLRAGEPNARLRSLLR